MAPRRLHKEKLRICNRACGEQNRFWQLQLSIFGSFRGCAAYLTPAKRRETLLVVSATVSEQLKRDNANGKFVFRGTIRLPDSIDCVTRVLESSDRSVDIEGRPLYRRRLRYEEARSRLDRYYAPYHSALAALIAELKAQIQK